MMKAHEHFVAGADFGSDSVRVVILDAADGRVAGQHVVYYPRWKQGLYCSPKENQFRQHPLDYTESLAEAVTGAVREAVAAGEKNIAGLIRAICVDTTGSTPVLADRAGTPLALLPEFKDDPDAMFILWKDHTAVKEADEINRVARTWGGTDFTKYMGGVYSSEWFWAKDPPHDPQERARREGRIYRRRALRLDYRRDDGHRRSRENQARSLLGRSQDYVAPGMGRLSAARVLRQIRF